MEPTALSLLPALVTITLAFATRQVILSLFAGVITGSLVLLAETGDPSLANPITAFLFPAIGSQGYASMLLDLRFLVPLVSTPMAAWWWVLVLVPTDKRPGLPAWGLWGLWGL